MPFDKLEKFRDHSHYKSVLKAELQKVAGTPVKYQYFEKFKFQGGKGDGEPFVAVGAYANTFIDELKNAGAVYKARGRMAAAEGQPLRFTVEHGALTEAKLNLALKEVAAKASLAESLDSDEGKADLAAEPAATGEVVRNRGGQGAGVAGALAQATATRDKLSQLMQTLGQKLPTRTRDQVRVALAAVEEALARGDVTAAERELGEARMRLDSYVAEAKSDREKAVDAEVGQQIGAHDKATQDVAQLPAAITAHAEEVKRLANITKGLNNTKEKFRTNSWQKQVTENEAQVAAAAVKAQKLATRLAGAQELLKDDSVRATALRTQLVSLLRDLKEAQDEVRRLSIDPETSATGGPPGRVAASPGLARASDALAQKMAPIAEAQVAHVAAIKEVDKLVRELRRRYDAIDTALDPECAAPLEALEDKVRALLSDPPVDNAFRAPLLAKAKPILAWLAARESLVDLVKSRNVEASYKAYRQKSPQDGMLLRAKERLDEMLAGSGTPTDKQILTLMIILAPQGDSELLERMKIREGSVDEAAAWGDTALKNGLLRKVWRNSAKAAKAGGGQPETIKGESLEVVEAAIQAWRAVRHDAPLSVSNMHVPGGGRPQYKADKNVTRADIQANFMSAWNGRMINQHVEIVTSNRGQLYDANGRVIEAVVNQLVDEGRLNRG